MFNTEISNVNTTLTSSINTINSYLTHVVYGDGANPDAQFRLSRNTVNFTEGFPDGLGNFNLIIPHSYPFSNPPDVAVSLTNNLGDGTVPPYAVAIQSVTTSEVTVVISALTGPAPTNADPYAITVLAYGI